MNKNQQKQPPKKNKNEQKKKEPFSTKIELSEKAYGIYKLLKKFQNEETEEADKGFYSEENSSSNAIQEAASAIDALYSVAPIAWQRKMADKRGLKLSVKLIILNKTSFSSTQIKEIITQVEEYALKIYPRN